MTRTQKLEKPDPDAVYVAWQGFAAGDSIVVSQGTRLRGDSPAVVAMPHCFVRDGTPENEWPSRWDFVPPPNNGRSARSR